MKSPIFEEAICNIDDDLIAAADVNTALMKKKKKIRLFPAAAAACLVLVCAAACLPLLRNGGQTPNAGTEIDEAGGLNGKINLKAEPILTGLEFEVSNEEGYVFLANSYEGICGTLEAFGVSAKGLTISTAGYAHMRTGDAGNSMAVNWRDYLAYKDGEILAVLTVMKDQDGLHQYLAWGSPGFSDLGRFLAEHTGEELVFIWAGDVDAVLAPDGTIYSPSDISEAIVKEEKSQYYSFFKRVQNTYTP